MFLTDSQAPTFTYSIPQTGPLAGREVLIFILHSLFRDGKGQSPKTFLTRTADVRVAY